MTIEKARKALMAVIVNTSCMGVNKTITDE